MIGIPILAAMDWQKIVMELLVSGLTQKQLGEAVGRSQPQICELKEGRTRQVEWSVGERLLALHRDRCRLRSASLAAKSIEPFAVPSHNKR